MSNTVRKAHKMLSLFTPRDFHRRNSIEDALDTSQFHEEELIDVEDELVDDNIENLVKIFADLSIKGKRNF